MQELESFESGELKPLLEALLLVSDDSVPATEWQETRNKAEASVESIQIAAQLREL